MWDEKDFWQPVQQPSEWSRHPDNDFAPLFFALLDTARLVGWEAERWLPGSFMTPLQARVAWIAEPGGGGKPVSRIADLTRISMPAATRLVNRMCRIGLCTREEHSHDGRCVGIHLTAKGVDQMHDIVRHLETFERALSRRLRGASSEALVTWLDELVAGT